MLHNDPLVSAYEKFPIGDALDSGVLVGPLIDQDAVDQFLTAVETAKKQGGEVLVGGESVARDGFFVKPTLIKADVSMPITKHETFAPILYIFEYEDLNDAIAANNDVPQGLSSAIFSDSFRSVERFLSAGSDCGIANVNIGTSGADWWCLVEKKKLVVSKRGWIDSWKRTCRQTCTLIGLQIYWHKA